MRRKPAEDLQAGPVVPERLRACIVEDWVDPAEVRAAPGPWSMTRADWAELHAFMAHRRARRQWCVEHGINAWASKELFVGGRPVWRHRD